jgi:subtilisin family serine protease
MKTRYSNRGCLHLQGQQTWPRQTARTLLAALSVFFSLTIGVSASSTPPAAEYIAGDVIVTFKPSVGSATAEQRLASHALVWKRHFAGLSRFRGRETGLVHAKSRTTEALIAELKQDPDVETAEPNYLRWAASPTPNDTYFSYQWDLQNTGQAVGADPLAAGTRGDDIHFLGAWGLARLPNTNPPVVAVIDSGVDYTHPDLAGNIWINTAENPTNGLDNDGDGYTNDYYGYDFADGLPDPMDSGDHGTLMSGTIAAIGNNNMGIIGVDYQAKIMALHAFETNGITIHDSTAIEAIQYAIMMKNRGANIVAINASWGGAGYDSALASAITEAGNAGIIFCAAAGNNSSDNDTTPFYPASYRLNNEIVAAETDWNDALSSISDYGANTVDLAAPGYFILSLLPVSPIIMNVDGSGIITLVQQGSNFYTAEGLRYSGLPTGFTGTVYDCGFGTPADFPMAASNYIALIMQGSLTISNQVVNAMAAGARAVLFYISNYASADFYTGMGTPGNWIPALLLSQADWLELQANASATLVPEPYEGFPGGTSDATAHVSGAVAFAAMNFPNETVTQRIQRILANVDMVPGLKGKVRTGGRLDLQRIVDTDGNGLPDWWEQEYFGHLTGTDPNADPDHDGMNNLAEWIAGTDPTNAASNLRLSVESADANGVVLNWPSVAGKTYWLERATNLQAGFDSTVATNIAATAPTNTQSDTTILPGTARFYRVGVEQ